MQHGAEAAVLIAAQRALYFPNYNVLPGRDAPCPKQDLEP